MPQLLPVAIAAGASTALAGGFGAAVAAGSITAFASGVSLAAVASSAALAVATVGLQLATAKKSGGIGPTSSFVQRTPVFLPDVYGETRVGGAAAYYRQSTDASNNDLLTVWVLAVHALDAVTEIRYGDELMWTPGGGLEPDFDGRATVAVQLGHGAATPPADLLAGADGVLDSNFKLTGKPYVYIRFSKVTGRKTKWPQGIDPGRLWFRVRGKRVYDPRTETTGYSANWALCFRDWLINRGGMIPALFDVSQIIAAANLCDEEVSLGGSPETFQNRYEVNGAFRSEIAPRDLIGDWLRQGGNLRGLVNSGDRLLLVPGAYAAPVASFGPDDFLAPVRLEPETNVEDRWEGVQSVFAEPANFFNATDTAAVILDEYTGPDEDARLLEIEYARETSGERATRLGLLALRQSRRVQKISFAVPLDEVNAALLPGERLQATLAPAGIDGVFEIVERRTVLEAERPRVEITALEDSSAFWGWTAETATAVPPGLGSTLGNPFFVAPVTGVTATANRRTEPDGSITRWVDVSWTAPAAEPFLDRYRVQWVQGGETRDAETTATRFRINNLGAAGAVTVTVFTVNTLGRESEGVAAGDVTPGGDVTPPGPPPSGAIFPVAGGFRFLIGNPTDADLAGLRLYEGAASAAFGATTAILDVAATPGGQDTPILRQGVAAGTTRRFFVTAFDRSGNESTAFGPLEDTTPTELTPEEIDEAIADAVSLAAAAEAEAAAALAAATANGTSITQLQTDATALSASFAAGQTINALRNSEFTLGTDYWVIAGGAAPEYVWGIRFLGSIFSGSTERERPLFIERNPDSVDQDAQIYSNGQRTAFASTLAGVPVRPDAWIEVSANVGASNCEAQIGIQWRDAAGAILSTVYSDRVSTHVSFSPAANERLWLKAQAPAGAARVVFVLRIRESTNTAADAFAIMLRPQLCVSSAGATGPQPYTAGAAGDAGAVDAYFRQSVGVLADDGLAVAQEIESQGARLDDAEADITTISTTKVDASGAVSAVNATVSAASVSGVATVNQLTTAYSTLNTDARAFDVLTVTSGNKVARRTLGATPNGSLIEFDANQVLFRADKFQVANNSGGGARAIFTVEGGNAVIDGGLILKGASIDALRMGLNSVTQFFETNASFGADEFDDTDNIPLFTITMPRAGVAQIQGVISLTTTLGLRSVQLRRNGVLIRQINFSGFTEYTIDFRAPVTPLVSGLTNITIQVGGGTISNVVTAFSMIAATS